MAGLTVRQLLARITGITICAIVLSCAVWHSVNAADVEKFHLNIGFSSHAFVNVPKDDIRVAVCILAKKVARKASGSAESRVYDSTSEMERDLRNHKLDIIALTPDDFLDIKHRIPLDPVMITATDKGYEVDLLLLVRKDSHLLTLKDLKNRSIVIPSINAQNGNVYHIWLEMLLAREGFPGTDSFFSSIQEARTASQALMPVFFRTADACVVTGHILDLASELNPQVGRELKVLAKMGKLAGGIIALRHDLPAQRKQKIKEALLTLQDDQEGRQLFVLFQLERLVPFRPEYLKETEAFIAEHHQLLKISSGQRR
jgi:ABC-type phosphate/phosphonate transport system substrate-binding protein